MRTVFWDYQKNQLYLIDQRRLPAALELFPVNTYQDVEFAIRNMVVRGAPAIGASAAFGLAVVAINSSANDLDGIISEMKLAKNVLKSARPTAVNLEWGMNRIMEAAIGFIGSVNDFQNFILMKAQELADEDVILNKKMAEIGANLLEDGDTIIHHCNTGALATVDWGTALGVIRTAYQQGKRIRVLIDETRPRLQGSRLTAWELEQYNIPYEIITDNMAGYFLSSGQANKVVFGADRVAANGDIANKIGTYMLALAAMDNNVPVYAVFPTSTIDLSLEKGSLIPIEERSEEEVLDLQYKQERVTPNGARARNPAFDITPNRLITAMITEKGVVYPPFKENLRNCFE